MIIMKTNKLLNIIGGVLVAASNILYVGGCGPGGGTTSPALWNKWVDEENAKRQAEENARIRQWNAWVTEENAKRQAQSQKNYQTSPPQNNLEKDAEEAATRGVGNFVGEVLIREYFK